jgi:hypothetical protein
MVRLRVELVAAVAAVLALGGIIFSRAESRTERPPPTLSWIEGSVVSVSCTLIDPLAKRFHEPHDQVASVSFSVAVFGNSHYF